MNPNSNNKIETEFFQTTNIPELFPNIRTNSKADDQTNTQINSQTNIVSHHHKASTKDLSPIHENNNDIQIEPFLPTQEENGPTLGKQMSRNIMHFYDINKKLHNPFMKSLASDSTIKTSTPKAKPPLGLPSFMSAKVAPLDFSKMNNNSNREGLQNPLRKIRTLGMTKSQKNLNVKTMNELFGGDQEQLSQRKKESENQLSFEKKHTRNFKGRHFQYRRSRTFNDATRFFPKKEDPLEEIKEVNEKSKFQEVSSARFEKHDSVRTTKVITEDSKPPPLETEKPFLSPENPGSDSNDEEQTESGGKKLDFQSSLTAIIKNQRKYKENQERIKGSGAKSHLLIRDVMYFDKFIILPDDNIRRKWDILIALLLLFVAIITPYRIAFIEVDTTEWIIVDCMIDILFSIDIFLNFFSAYYDEDDNLISDRKVIARRYLTSWFLLDFIAVIPISLILKTEKDYNGLARMARLPRLYRLLKLTKLARVMKIAKERNKLKTYFNELFRVKIGLERLFYFAFLLFIVCHIAACIWYLVGKLNEDNCENWILFNGFQDKSNMDLYLFSYFWSLTMITGMGESGIIAKTRGETIMTIIMMIIGTFAYSFALGSLTSVLSSLDAKKAKLKEKLSTLEDLRAEYQINYKTYIKLRKALKYDHSRNESDKFQFLQELPKSLNVELALIMHEEMINKIPFFQHRNPHFIAYIGPLLKPIKVLEGEYIYLENDPIDNIYFLVKGSAAFVVKGCPDIPFLYIEEGNIFGEFDMVTEVGISEKRQFTIKAIEECELLVLKKEDLYKIDIEFPEIVEELFKPAKSKTQKLLEIRKSADQFINNNFLRLFTLRNPQPRGSIVERMLSLNEKGVQEFEGTLKKLEEQIESSSSSSESSESQISPQELSLVTSRNGKNERKESRKTVTNFLAVQALQPRRTSKSNRSYSMVKQSLQDFSKYGNLPSPKNIAVKYHKRNKSLKRLSSKQTSDSNCDFKSLIKLTPVSPNATSPLGSPKSPRIPPTSPNIKIRESIMSRRQRGQNSPSKFMTRENKVD